MRPQPHIVDFSTRPPSGLSQATRKRPTAMHGRRGPPTAAGAGGKRSEPCGKRTNMTYKMGAPPGLSRRCRVVDAYEVGPASRNTKRLQLQ
jgi:hypothetical protein